MCVYMSREEGNFFVAWNRRISGAISIYIVTFHGFGFIYKVGIGGTILINNYKIAKFMSGVEMVFLSMNEWW
jgi:hypothetical protein